MSIHPLVLLLVVEVYMEANFTMIVVDILVKNYMEIAPLLVLLLLYF